MLEILTLFSLLIIFQLTGRKTCNSKNEFLTVVDRRVIYFATVDKFTIMKKKLLVHGKEIKFHVKR
jgi:hypothetical protein